MGNGGTLTDAELCIAGAPLENGDGKSRESAKLRTPPILRR